MADIFEGVGTGWRSASQPVLIRAGQSLSDDISLGSRRLFALQMPAAWTAADLTFQSTINGIDWFDVFDEYGIERVMSAGAGRIIVADPGLWLALSQLRLRSGTSGAPVAQGADRQIFLLGVP